jgi:hypothetical protein
MEVELLLLAGASVPALGILLSIRYPTSAAPVRLRCVLQTILHIYSLAWPPIWLTCCYVVISVHHVNVFALAAEKRNIRMPWSESMLIFGQVFGLSFRPNRNWRKL